MLSGRTSRGGGNFSTHVYKLFRHITTFNLDTPLARFFARGVIDLTMRLQLEEQISPIDEQQ